MIEEMLNFRDLVQLYHWHTKNYARHKASGDLYDKFQANLDLFVEAYQKNGKRIVAKGKIDLYETSDKDVVELLEDFLEFVAELEEKFSDRTDLLNILADITQDINQTLYLFTLN
jgi:hypothetical protein